MMTTLEELIDHVKKDFKNSEIHLKTYVNNDYIKYIHHNNSSKYHRERIYIDDEIEVFIITWGKNQEAKMHNHSENGCFLKILEGSLEETIYSNNENIKRILTKGSISYMNDNIGLHSVVNLDNVLCVSLHIYSPPNHTTTFFL